MKHVFYGAQFHYSCFNIIICSGSLFLRWQQTLNSPTSLSFRGAENCLMQCSQGTAVPLTTRAERSHCCYCTTTGPTPHAYSRRSDTRVILALRKWPNATAELGPGLLLPTPFLNVSSAYFWIHASHPANTNSC